MEAKCSQTAIVCTSSARELGTSSQVPRIDSSRIRTMARSFSLALNDLFKIDNSLADLDAAVSEKYVLSSLLDPLK